MPAGVNPAYVFVAPALSLIAVFFLVPVAASFLLSLTDFDIYAVADLANLRFVGAAQLHARCCTTRSSGRRCATPLYFVVVAGPLSVAVSLAAALLVTAAVVRLQGALPHRSSSCRSSPGWSRSRWCGATSTTRASAC